MLWVAAVSDVVLNVATPPDMLLLPRVVDPSLNVTDPVAPVVTVAVNVTESPYPDGLVPPVRAILVDDDAWPTLKFPVAELAPKLPWATKVALKVWEPTDRMPTSIVATPELNPQTNGVTPSTSRLPLPIVSSIPELTVTVTIPCAPDATEGAFKLIVVWAWFTV